MKYKPGDYVYCRSNSGGYIMGKVLQAISYKTILTLFLKKKYKYLIEVKNIHGAPINMVVMVVVKEKKLKPLTTSNQIDNQKVIPLWK